MGGYQAGEHASQMAVESLTRQLRSFDPADGLTIEEYLANALYDVHQKIRQAGATDDGLYGMGTTMVAAWIPKIVSAVWLLHVGDSRAYLMRAGDLQLLTEDHTYFFQLQQAGKLPDDPLDWPPRNLLSQAIGATDLIYPEVDKIQVKFSDRLLLCSDGLTSVVGDAELAELLRAKSPVERTSQELIDAALNNKASDNVTVIVIAAV
jgi:protein phosphatase